VRLFAAEPVQLLRDTMQQYADVLLFLSLAAGLAFLLQDTADRALLELAAAGGTTMGQILAARGGYRSLLGLVMAAPPILLLAAV